jgi:hypothetical protein
MKLLWGHFVVSSFSLWTPGFNFWPAGIRFMLDRGALVQVFSKDCAFAGSVLFNQCSIFVQLSLTLLTVVSIRKVEVFMCGYQKCGVCWRKFCGVWSPVKWKCLGMSILSFRLLCRYVEMTGVTSSTYWYGIYISVDSLRQASLKCIVLCLTL